MHFPRLTTTLHYPPLPGRKLSRFQHIPELLACKKSAYPSPLRCAVHKIGIRASCSKADKEKCPEACKQRSKAHYQHFLLRPRSKNREVLVHRLKGEWEFVWQVKMQNCKGSLEPANANSSNGSVSNQVLFTSHIVLKSDVIPIPNTLTCHRLQREIYSFRKKPIYLAAAFSEPGWRQRACVPFPPPTSPPQKKHSQDMGKIGEKPINHCHSETSRLQESGSRASPSRAAPQPGRGRRKALTIAAEIRPGVGDAASRRAVPGRGRSRGDAELLRGNGAAGAGLPPPGSHRPEEERRGGRGRSLRRESQFLLPRLPVMSRLLCSGDGPGPGREGICHR